MYQKNDLRIVQGVTAALGLTPTGDSASRSATERRDSRACQPTKNQVSAQESAGSCLLALAVTSFPSEGRVRRQCEGYLCQNTRGGGR